MKSTLIRIFTIMTLATSMFAMSEKAKDASSNKKHSDETTVCTPADQQNSQGQSDEGDSRSRKIEQQNKQWLHDLQGIYGG